MENASLVALIQAAAILSIKMWLAGTITTYVRGKAMEGPNEEDSQVMNFFNKVFFVPVRELSVLPDNSERDHTVNRWIRIGLNDAANIPVALIIFFLAAWFDGLSIRPLN